MAGFVPDVMRNLVTAVRQKREATRRKQAFGQIYRESRWGRDPSTKYYSGHGSRGHAVDAYVDSMAERLAADQQALGRPLTIVDVGCGDFEVGRRLLQRLPEARYIGCDLVPDMIASHQKEYGDHRTSFMVLDAVEDELPAGDVCLIRQVLQHLSNADISGILQKIAYPLLYVTESHPLEQVGPANPDKPAGEDVRFDWRTGRGGSVQLSLPPYSRRSEEILRVQRDKELIITERIW